MLGELIIVTSQTLLIETEKIQGAVTYMQPVELFMNGIKKFD